MCIHIAWLYLTHFGFVRFLKLCFLIVIIGRIVIIRQPHVSGYYY
jgi:hypothetical protein